MAKYGTPSPGDAPGLAAIMHRMKQEARSEDEKFRQSVQDEDDFYPTSDPDEFGESPVSPDEPAHVGRVGEPRDMSTTDPRMFTGADPRKDTSDDIPLQARELKEGIYDGAGGYRYEVMPGGEIKIVGAPGGRGVGTTLKGPHPAHEAIYEELIESGQDPMDSNPEYEAMAKTFDEMSAGQKKRAESDKDVAGKADSGGPSKVTLTGEAKAAFERTKARTSKKS
tara:strand:+ start:91 stop:762 length:672 start_codon:yes stop_codon:yes gene_type:complete